MEIWHIFFFLLNKEIDKVKYIWNLSRRFLDTIHVEWFLHYGVNVLVFSKIHSIDNCRSFIKNQGHIIFWLSLSSVVPGFLSAPKIRGFEHGQPLTVESFHQLVHNTHLLSPLRFRLFILVFVDVWNDRNWYNSKLAIHWRILFPRPLQSFTFLFNKFAIVGNDYSSERSL